MSVIDHTLSVNDRTLSVNDRTLSVNPRTLSVNPRTLSVNYYSPKDLRTVHYICALLVNRTIIDVNHRRISCVELLFSLF